MKINITLGLIWFGLVSKNILLNARQNKNLTNQSDSIEERKKNIAKSEVAKNTHSKLSRFVICILASR